MSHICTFIPPHLLDHIARVQGSESLEPSAAQRSSVLSAHFRRLRRLTGTSAADSPRTGARSLAGTSLTIPKAGSAGRLIYDADHTTEYDHTLVRGEDDPAVPGDNANRAYDGLGTVLAFYQEKLGRNSIDNQGLNLDANVNFDNDFDNAFFDGDALVMVFGNGDGKIFKDLTDDIDVLGHELTHGVTQFTAALNYTNDQTGALNESFSDMMGSAIDAWINKRDADTHNWLIGDGIMADDLYGEALRNMAEPGTAYDNPVLGRDPQPRDMSGYADADPHVMSGITNRWFYLICKEIGMDAGTLIMYQTLQNLWPTAVFHDAAEVAAGQARILARTEQVPAEAAQVVRSAARQQGFW